MESTWVVVANRGFAEIFSTQGIGRPWEMVWSCEQPEARLKNADLETDRPGRTFDSNSRSAGRHAVSGADHTDELIQQFAKKVSDYIEHKGKERSYGHLILVAEPKFLGELRKDLGKNAEEKLVGSLDKDLVALPAAELKIQVKPLLEEARRQELNPVQ